jgi:hypothetical protein
MWRAFQESGGPRRCQQRDFSDLTNAVWGKFMASSQARAGQSSSFPLLVNLLVGSAVQLGDHKGKEVAASCINHFVLAQVLSPSLT